MYTIISMVITLPIFGILFAADRKLWIIGDLPPVVTASAVVAVPASRPDFAYIASGTWSLVGVELPARPGARSARIGNTQATSNAARRDASASKMAEVFRSGSLGPAVKRASSDRHRAPLGHWYSRPAAFGQHRAPRDKYVAALVHRRIKVGLCCQLTAPPRSFVPASMGN